MFCGSLLSSRFFRKRLAGLERGSCHPGGLAQPQEDAHWLHCFLDYRNEMLAQLREIDLIRSGGQ
jgi:hypothetical protein